jgi:hypothetical protein
MIQVFITDLIIFQNGVHSILFFNEIFNHVQTDAYAECNHKTGI